MASIRILDQALINKIAAGEVVERPASVVKELVENSLDAGASEMRIDIEHGGLGLIRVTDNGCGMDAEDLRLSVQRYATSKIQRIEDLNHLESFGFRGEALAAIAAVSDFTMISRRAQDTGAMLLSFEQGKARLRPAAGSVGTVVEVRGLFHTVPARKKFMKTPATEFRHILTIVSQQACLHPHVSWVLSHNGEVVFDAPVAKDWKDRVASLLGKDIAKDMLTVRHQRASLIVTGFLGHPSRAGVSRADQYVFVNRRPVQDFLLLKAVRQGYSHHMEPNKQPAFVVHVSIAPDLVDVNVHPRKSEVKFADPSGVFREVHHAVHEALEAVATRVVEMSQGSVGRPGQGTVSFTANKPSAADLFQTKSAWEYAHTVARPQTQTAAAVNMPTAELGDWKLLGQLHRCFLLVESSEGLLVIDQHAAAEKILYERMLAQQDQVRQQALLMPLVVELTPAQFALVMENQEALKTLAIEVEEFGKHTVRLTGVPQDMEMHDLKKFFLELVQDMQEEGKGPASLAKRRESLAKMAACRGAIKFADALALAEQLKLLADIRRYNITACCHGRPVMKKLTLEQLRREFHRP